MVPADIIPGIQGLDQTLMMAEESMLQFRPPMYIALDSDQNVLSTHLPSPALKLGCSSLAISDGCIAEFCVCRVVCTAGSLALES